MIGISKIAVWSFLFFLGNSLFAEVIGNFEFHPPVSLTGWVMNESSRDNEGPLKLFNQHYVNENDAFIESLDLLNYFSDEIDVFKYGYSKIQDIESYLTNKYQKIANIASAEDENYSFVSVSVTDIISDPVSIFYKVTLLQEGRVFAYTWYREIKEKGRWIQFGYGVREKYPHDPNFSVEATEEIAHPWVKFLKDDFLAYFGLKN